MSYVHHSFVSQSAAAARLPAIEACQSGIFHELRNRETRITRTKPGTQGDKAPRLFLFRQQLNALFAPAAPQFS
jgi:hypothetical protein